MLFYPQSALLKIAPGAAGWFGCPLPKWRNLAGFCHSFGFYPLQRQYIVHRQERIFPRHNATQKPYGPQRRREKLVPVIPLFALPLLYTCKKASREYCSPGACRLPADLLALFPGLFLLFGFGGFIRPLGGVDDRPQQLQLLLDGAVQFINGADDKIGVDRQDPPGQFPFAFLGLGIMYDHLNGCAGSHPVHLPLLPSGAFYGAVPVPYAPRLYSGVLFSHLSF